MEQGCSYSPITHNSRGQLSFRILEDKQELGSTKCLRKELINNDHLLKILFHF